MAVLFWRLTYQMDLQRIDRELRNLGSPQLERVNGGEHWIRFESALGFIDKRDGKPAFVLWVKHGDRVLHKSEHWPVEIDPENFPALIDYETPFHLAPGQSPPPPPRRGEEISPRNPALPRKEAQFYTRDGGGKTWRVAVMGNPYMTMIIGADLNEFTAGMTQLRNAYLAAMLVVLVLVAAGAWLLANRALRPVSLLTQTVDKVTAKGLDQRLPSKDFDQEFSRLLTVFNEMMNRLETSFHQANRFSADAAHELKTPLTILQGELEQALQSAESGSEQQLLFGRLIEEITRLRAITDKLLMLAQADAGKLPVQREELNLSTLTLEFAEDVSVLAPELHLKLDVTPDILINADPHLIGQVIQNLTTNAVKYNREGGMVGIALSRDRDQVVLRVSNTGTGIPGPEEAKVFDRFYRIESSRSRELGGVGLGLSLAREIVRAHGGDLTLERSDANKTVFRASFPA